MAIDYAKLKGWAFPDSKHRYTERDTMLYALGVGCGHDPTDCSDLRYVHEDSLQALPALGVMLGSPGFRLKDPEIGIDWTKAMQVEQGLNLHCPLPASGTVIGRSRVNEVLDEGPGRDAVLYTEREVIDCTSGERLCTASSAILLREHGGFGGYRGPAPGPHPVPDHAPDLILDLPIPPQAALICRLCGNDNPLEADPAKAAESGFPRQILHGHSTYGVACRAILRACCHNDPARLESLYARFTAPAFPGETIRTEMWCDVTRVTFRCRVMERNSVVLNNGLAVLSSGASAAWQATPRIAVEQPLCSPGQFSEKTPPAFR